MKASRLIFQLQTLIAKHGDCDVDVDVDDIRLQGAEFIPHAPTLVAEYGPGVIALETAGEEICCFHCGHACGDSDTDTDFEVRWPDNCPSCGKRPNQE